MHRAFGAAALLAAAQVLHASGSDVRREPFPLDRAAETWVAHTIATMTIEQKVGQLIVPAFHAEFVSSDSDAFDRLAGEVRDLHVGGFHVFGATEAAPPVLLNPTYGTTILGQPLAAASLLNRLQDLSELPLLNTADFEAGPGFRLAGATTFPREMAFGAARDGRLVHEAARLTGLEARAVGVQVDLAPVADVNDNPRNPVINTRSYGEAPAQVAALVGDFVEGAREGRMIAALKHFPGHGDTDVDTHLGLPVIPYDRARLDRVELVPFRAGLQRGADAVMTSHIELPALDPTGTPATFSAPITTGLLRDALGFDGLVYTDSLSMASIQPVAPPGEAAVLAVLAGADQVLEPSDPAATFAGLQAAAESGRITKERLDASVRRLLRAKAFLGLQRHRRVDLDALPAVVGSRAHLAVAEEAAARSITLVRDDRQQVPLAVPRGTAILYLSVLDYPSGWRIAAPSRTFIPELKKRWPDVTAIEISDHTSASDLDLVHAIAPRYGAVLASVFVRASSGSGRMDLAPEPARLLRDLAAITARTKAPYVVTLFGNPYTAAFLGDVPALLLTYDFYDLPERAAVRAIAGEASIGGRLPITLGGALPLGFGLDRPDRGGR
jgi:beta-N-acetylhexosaminidase